MAGQGDPEGIEVPQGVANILGRSALVLIRRSGQVGADQLFGDLE
jgi:hypothetical protein